MNKIVRISVALLAVSLLAMGGAGCTANAKKARHLSRADRYYDAGQFAQAEIEYLNVLHIEPSDSRANARLGLLYYDEGRLQRAAYFLTKASQLSPDDLELRDKLGFTDTAFGLYSNAIVQADYVLGKNPRDHEAPLLLMEASVLPRDAAAARQRLETMARSGDSATIEVALGNLALRNHDLAAAVADFKKAQAMDPKSSVVIVGLAAAAWAQGELSQAAAFFKEAADASPVRSPHRMQYIRFKVQTGDVEGARALLADIIKAAPDYVPASKALAEIAASEKKYDESAQLLDNVLKLDPDNFDTLIFQAELDMARGQPEQCVSHLERMARIYPRIATVHYQLGAAYVAVNDLAKATASFNRALEINPNFVEATMMLAQVQMKTGNANAAILSLEKVRQKQPQMVQAQLLLADAYRARSRVGDAVAIYEKLETQFPTNAQVRLLHGGALLEAKDNAAARRVFERALELSPGYLPTIEQLVKLDISEMQFDAALQLINRNIQNAPKQATLRILAATVLLAQGKHTEAETVLTQVLETEPSNESAALMLAQSYADSGQNDKALAKVGAVLAKDPGNVSALMFAAGIYSALKDNKNAAAAYEKLLKLDPKHSAALNNLAYIYAEYLNDLDRAYDLAQRARQLLPVDPSTADTLGWICFKRGTYDTALGLLKESAAELSDPEVQFHYGMAGYMTGDEAAARAALLRAWQSGVDFRGRAECGVCLSVLDVNPDTADASVRAKLEQRIVQKADDPVALSRLARIYLREGNTDKAISTFEAALQASPKNLDVMVNLTRLYAAKDPKKAYEMAKAANKLSPYDPAASHLLGHLAFLSGDYQFAASVLQQAVQNTPGDASLLFDYAQAVYSIGGVTAAQAALQNALALNLPAAQVEPARQMFDMISLAAIPAQAAAASAHIDGILKSQPDNVPALMARAVASQSGSDTVAVSQACEKVLAIYPDFIPAEERLALLYATDPSKSDRAFSLASKAHDSLPDDPSAAKILGIILVQRGDYSRAASLLKQSALKLNSDAEVFFYLGSAQFRLKNRTESKASLQQALALNLPVPLANSARQMLNELK